jgi:polysaccharide export outer membrane protein
MKRIASSLNPAASICLSACLIVMAGCTFLPSSGPSAFRMKLDSGRKSVEPEYRVLQLDQSTAAAVRVHGPQPVYIAADGRPTDSLFMKRGIEKLGAGNSQGIRAGDTVRVSVFETGGGLFTPLAAEAGGAGAPLTTLPEQTVDTSGAISVPYVGRLQVKGKLPSQVEKEIATKLAEKTVDPQVVVSVIDRKGGDLVTVGGDVKAPAQVPVSLAGTRLLDAIMATGGSLSRPHQTMVSVTRGSSTLSDPLQDIFDVPGKNISLQPQDTILVRNRPLSFLVFGAGGMVSSQPIPVEDLSLAEAAAITGGPNDNKANPAAVFVYRREPRALLEQLGQKNLPSGEFVPVIYQLNLLKPEGFFVARDFTVRDKDILYYSSASSVGVLKFMSLLNAFFAPARSGFTTAAGAEVF